MKFCIFLLIIFSATNILFSQQFYLKAGGGYAFGTAAKEYISYTRNFDNSGRAENNYFSYGSGISVGCAAGYTLNSNIAFEVEYQYSISNNMEINMNSAYEDASYYQKTTLSSKTSSITPSILLMTKLGDFKPYFKIGPIIAFPVMEEEGLDFYSSENTKLTYNTKFIMKGGSGLGVSSAIGVLWQTGKIIDVYFEIKNTSLTYGPEKGKLERADINGVSRLYDIAINEKEFEYTDEYTYEGDERDKPRKGLKTRYPFSNLAFSVGISIML